MWGNIESNTHNKEANSTSQEVITSTEWQEVITSTEWQKVIETAKEKTALIKAETLRWISESLLKKAEINSKKAIELTAGILWVPAIYNETFVTLLRKFQKDNKLKVDGKLWDKTLEKIINKNIKKIQD